MAKIIKIIKFDRKKRVTTAIVSGRFGEVEATGYGKYSEGERVQRFFHDKYHRPKFRKLQ